MWFFKNRNDLPSGVEILKDWKSFRIGSHIGRRSFRIGGPSGTHSGLKPHQDSRYFKIGGHSGLRYFKIEYIVGLDILESWRSFKIGSLLGWGFFRN